MKTISRMINRCGGSTAVALLLLVSGWQAVQAQTGTRLPDAGHQAALRTVGNPYLPLWEHIPDGEPYVFEDPHHPGKQRVYIYGSHDDMKTHYCGRDLVVWSAPVEDLSQWRFDGTILVVDKNAKGEPFDSAGTADVLYAPDVAVVKDANGKPTYYLYPNDQAWPLLPVFVRHKSEVALHPPRFRVQVRTAIEDI